MTYTVATTGGQHVLFLILFLWKCFSHWWKSILTLRLHYSQLLEFIFLKQFKQVNLFQKEAYADTQKSSIFNPFFSPTCFLVAGFLSDELRELWGLLAGATYLHNAAFTKEIRFWTCPCTVNGDSFMTVIYFKKSSSAGQENPFPNWHICSLDYCSNSSDIKPPLLLPFHPIRLRSCGLIY